MLKENFHVSGRELMDGFKPDLSKQWSLDELKTIGYDFSTMDAALAGSAVQSGFLDPRFLTAEFAGVIRQPVSRSSVDALIGVTSVGAWEDEYIEFQVLESVGRAELYGDHANIPLANFTYNEDKRGIVRFEQGFETGVLEVARANKRGLDSGAEKRRAAKQSLDMQREDIGYYGFVTANTRTFGLLNEPNLLPYETAVAVWAGADFATVTGDIADMVSQLELQSDYKIKEDMKMTLVLPAGFGRFLNIANNAGNGQTVKQWIKESYPNLRVMQSPQFVGANGGANVAYLFVDNVEQEDGETATSQSLVQIVPAEYRMIGSNQGAKVYVETASNATAGVVAIHPWAVTRLSGI